MQRCDDKPGHMNRWECVKDKCSRENYNGMLGFILFQERERNMILDGAFLCSDRSVKPQPCDFKIVKASGSVLE